MSQLLHNMIRRVADARPESSAFRCGPQSLSYAELEINSNRLAHLLQTLGVAKGEPIGVFMPRCVESAIAIYGIIKTGCVFVPIDPSLPAAAVNHLSTDCGIKVLLTHPKKKRVLRGLLELPTSITTLVGFETTEHPHVQTLPWSALDVESDHGIEQSISENDPAYIMYSSGSTGKPKGITHTHSSGLAYARLSAETYGVQPGDVIGSHSPINFDMSTFGFFSSCYAGATAHIIPEAHTKVPSSLIRLIAEEEISIWYSVPLALVQMLLNSPIDEFPLPKLRWVLYGGEPFTPKHLQSLMGKWPHARFSNVYGPAEVNQCTYFHIPADYAMQNDRTPVPIGTTWDDTEALLLDSDDRPIHDETPGELLIHSPTMMCGYWRRPDLNERAFFVEKTTNKTYYRTGDLVCRRVDGNLEFLGRIDRQVKVRGYRVELDDLERALTEHPGVDEAGVFCVQQEQAKEIRATVITKPDAVLQPAELKKFLGNSYAAYAIPAVIRIVNSLPRTSSGKIDRNQLRMEAENNIVPTSGYEANH